MQNTLKTTLCLVFILSVLTFPRSHAQTTEDEKLRIIAFGAHPDDAELKASGVAAMWADQGHAVKFVAMTNGDIGHFQMAGGPLAQRREAEVEECARLLGIETEVLDIHDGELMPTLENRKKVARLIREWQADIVLCHRPYDYHPDHRYTGQLVQDAAVVVVAPFFVPDTPPTKKNPVFMFYSDGFQKPYPFEPTLVVGIDEVVNQKWDCVSAMPSQFGDEHSWQASTRPDVPSDEAERKAYLLDLVKQRNEAVADRYRDRLIELYGEEKGNQIQYAEAFELCQYGSQPDVETLKKLFPTFDD
jgi:LmbE family N-acetylglucosaminyl deacetylase